MQMVAAQLARRRVSIVTCGREDPLPGPRLRSIGQLARERAWKRDAPGAHSQVGAVQSLPLLQMSGQRLAQVSGEQGGAVLSSFPLTYDDLGGGKVDVFDAGARIRSGEVRLRTRGSP